MTVTPAPELTTLPDRRGRTTAADVAVAGLLAVVAFGLYFQSRHFEPIRFDDPIYLTQNWTVQRGITWAGLRYAATAIVSSNWHPLTLLVEMATVQLFGPSPGAFHLLSAALHAANVGLVYLFLRTATGLTWRSLAVAALWGYHPLRVEAAVWISDLKDVLCGFFWLLTLLAFVRYRRGGGPRWYAAVVAGTAAALLSKPMAVTLPVVLLLLEYWPLGPADAALDAGHPRPTWARRVAEYAPLLLLSAATAVVTLWTQSKTQAAGSLAEFPLSTRLANAAAAYWAYVRTSFVPTGLAYFYPHPSELHQSVPLVPALLGATLLVAVTVAVILLRRTRPYALVGWLWFVVTLVPVIGLVQVGHAARADRYTYLPAIGLTLAVVWGCAELAGRARPAGPALAAAAAGVAAVALSWATYVQAGYWIDEYTLASHAVAVVPDNYMAMDGVVLGDIAAGRTADAVRQARESVHAAPDLLDPNHALAMALAADGQLKPAFEAFENAIRIDRTDPFVRDDFGRLLFRLGRNKDAEAQYRRALHDYPDLAAAHTDYAVVLAAEGQMPMAIVEFHKALDLDPRSGPTHAYLGDALRLTGDSDGAVEQYRLALANGQNGTDVETNLVWLVSIDGRSTPAELAALKPVADDARARAPASDPLPPYYDSVRLARLGQFNAAIAAATEARGRAVAAKQPQLVAAIDRRLAAYRQYEPGASPATEPVTTRPAATAPAR
jgi:Flp pilus assembly protein TadD